MDTAEWYGLIFFGLLLISYAIAYWRERGQQVSFKVLEQAYFDQCHEVERLTKDLAAADRRLVKVSVIPLKPGEQEEGWRVAYGPPDPDPE